MDHSKLQGKPIEPFKYIAEKIQVRLAKERINNKDASEQFLEGIGHSIDIIDEWVEEFRQKFEAAASREDSTPMLDKFYAEKQGGTLKPWESITQTELYTLFITENCSDNEISSLFGIPKKIVTNKRYQWGIKFG